MAKRRKPAVAIRDLEAHGRGTLWMVLVLGAVISLTYLPALDAPFVFDDFATIVENPQLHEWSWTRAFSPPADTPVAGRPLVHLSFALNYAAGGLDPAGYRLVNVALHLASAIVLLFLLRKTLDQAAAFVVALFWALHPVNSEAVMYITQRTELMMAFFYLVTVFAAAHSVGRQGYAWPALAVAACLAGAGSKETIATAPLVVVLYDRVFVFPSIREALRRRWPLYAGLACTWLVLGALLLAGGQSISGGFSHAGQSPWNYLLNQAVIITRYLRLAVWPDALVLYYGWPQPLTLSEVWPYALFVLALLAAAVWLLRSRPHAGFWAAWFFLTLAPTSSVLPIATEVGAERRMYLPLAGLIVLAVIAATTVLQRQLRPGGRARIPIALAILAICATLIATTVRRTREYQSALVMASTVLERWPTSNAQQMVGTELARLGRHTEAIPHLREAVKGYSPARYFLGSSLLKTGATEEGVAELRMFIEQEPDALAARGAHGMIADALTEQQRFADAIPHYREYLKAKPDDAHAWNALGVALALTGSTVEAIDAFNGAVRTAPANAQMRVNLARALLAHGKAVEAAAVARDAARLDPRDPAPFDLLGRALAAQGRLDLARAQFLHALSLDPSYAPAIEALGAIRPPK